jgi:hypothetical protein
MKRFHIAIGVADISRSVDDYERHCNAAASRVGGSCGGRLRDADGCERNLAAERAAEAQAFLRAHPESSNTPLVRLKPAAR